MTEFNYVPLEGGRMGLRDVGSGDPVVLLHGGGVDHRMWDDQIDDLARGHRVIAPDARGHGRSTTPTTPFRHCDDLIALLDELAIEQATLVGLSMGGGTAVDTALEYPDRVRALVISGTGTSEPHFEDPWVLEVFAAWQRTQDAGDVEGWIEAFLRFVHGPQRSRAEVDPSVFDRCEQMVRDTLANHLRVDPDTGQPIVPIEPTPVTDTWSRVKAVDVPVLAITGGADSDDHHRLARRLVDSVPAGELATVPGAAHYPNMERPAEFNALVRDFLARV